MALSEKNMSNGVTLHYWHGLDTLAQSDGTTTRFFAYDGLGSVRQLTDSSGVVSLAQTFDPYGNGYLKSGAASTNLGFSGEITDSNGFVFLRARYYNPSMGRFFQLDTWGGDNNRPQSFNPYMYVEGQVVNFTDPTGQFPESGKPTQTASPSDPPAWWDGERFQVLDFVPEQNLQPVWESSKNHWRIPASQWDITGREDNNNLCGSVDLTAILQAIYGKGTFGVDEVVNIFESQVGSEAVKEPQVKEPLMYLATTIGLSATVGSPRTGNYEDYFNDLRQVLLNGTWPMVLVGIAPNPYHLVTYNDCYDHDEKGACKGNGHWIVISGLPRTDDWGKGPDWHWVRIFNSAINGTEYYKADWIFNRENPGNLTLYVTAPTGSPNGAPGPQ